MKKKKFREIKPEIRTIGIDDGAFEPDSEGETCLVGVVLRGGKWIDGVLVDEVEIDGRDSTSTIIDMIENSRHKDQLRVVLTSGITFAGFNVLDIDEIFKKTDLPVIVVSREKPDMHSIKKALKNLPDWEERWEILTSTEKIIPVTRKNSDRRKSTVYIQVKGMGEEEAKELVRLTSTRSSVPEPLRLAHLIATAISRGESVGRV
ncbi:hypothetical protein AKJ37_01245 [candidate division MSBL1 archaeon SCGC-AAA259I09]|uniref:UPF0215 protein AKJ37_01245 n=2 Tax=candidate division MSBL1 TaxID=215777 RepID=A0A133UVA8_9EURY|nr:hypothetical protein AKJ37_01245 [candidate division MSBL1 archaeon SCGC-AAA259I09]KXB00802.1 hypothetical protein AKJ40_00495 [candidate division MSBL1 archaeon SCGC-AAA259M10]